MKVGSIFSLQSATSGMHRDSENTARATVTAMLGASTTSSMLSRKVQLSDQELLERVQKVSVPNGPVDLRELSAQRDWKRVRAGISGGMKMYYRTTPPFQPQQCQVLVTGNIRAQVSELLSLLRAPTETESNTLLHALFGSRFIYSSLVHVAANSVRGSMASRESVASNQQLMVRTASFVHTWVPNPFKRRSSTSNSMTKNDQICYVELLTPTEEGFRLMFCSLDADEVTTGKAPPENAISLHPLSGWLTVEPSRTNPETLRLTFQAACLGNVSGGFDFQVARARLLFLGKGICRLNKLLRRRQRQSCQQYTASARLWQTIMKPFRALGDKSQHQNSHCIACTRSFLPMLRKRWRRCDLCAYRTCAEPPCCFQERVAIYNRYISSLSVCARCRECIDERNSDSRGSVSRIGGVRYAGLSLRLDDQTSEIDLEDPSIVSYDRVRMAEALKSVRRQKERPQMKRRTQSDPSI